MTGVARGIVSPCVPEPQLVLKSASGKAIKAATRRIDTTGFYLEFHWEMSFCPGLAGWNPCRRRAVVEKGYGLDQHDSLGGNGKDLDVSIRKDQF